MTERRKSPDRSRPIFPSLAKSLSAQPHKPWSGISGGSPFKDRVPRLNIGKFLSVESSVSVASEASFAPVAVPADSPTGQFVMKPRERIGFQGSPNPQLGIMGSPATISLHSSDSYTSRSSELTSLRQEFKEQEEHLTRLLRVVHELEERCHHLEDEKNVIEETAISHSEAQADEINRLHAFLEDLDADCKNHQVKISQLEIGLVERDRRLAEQDSLIVSLRTTIEKTLLERHDKEREATELRGKVYIEQQKATALTEVLSTLQKQLDRLQADASAQLMSPPLPRSHSVPLSDQLASAFSRVASSPAVLEGREGSLSAPIDRVSSPLIPPSPVGSVPSSPEQRPLTQSQSRELCDSSPTQSHVSSIGTRAREHTKGLQGELLTLRSERTSSRKMLQEWIDRCRAAEITNDRLVTEHQSLTEQLNRRQQEVKQLQEDLLILRGVRDALQQQLSSPRRPDSGVNTPQRDAMNTQLRAEIASLKEQLETAMLEKDESTKYLQSELNKLLVQQQRAKSSTRDDSETLRKELQEQRHLHMATVATANESLCQLQGEIEKVKSERDVLVQRLSAPSSPFPSVDASAELLIVKQRLRECEQELKQVTERKDSELQALQVQFDKMVLQQQELVSSHQNELADTKKMLLAEKDSIVCALQRQIDELSTSQQRAVDDRTGELSQLKQAVQNEIDAAKRFEVTVREQQRTIDAYQQELLSMPLLRADKDDLQRRVTSLTQQLDSANLSCTELREELAHREEEERRRLSDVLEEGCQTEESAAQNEGTLLFSEEETAKLRSDFQEAWTLNASYREQLDELEQQLQSQRARLEEEFSQKLSEARSGYEMKIADLKENIIHMATVSREQEARIADMLQKYGSGRVLNEEEERQLMQMVQQLKRDHQQDVAERDRQISDLTAELQQLKQEQPQAASEQPSTTPVANETSAVREQSRSEELVAEATRLGCGHAESLKTITQENFDLRLRVDALMKHNMAMEEKFYEMEDQLKGAEAHIRNLVKLTGK